ncbi:MAG: hypothetical protein GYB31_08510 [Bacteroidetes bacterium]|nr:hypothetical protein [Bacteroidota bacterium]
MINIAGILFEVLFLAIGIYVYLFAIGKIRFKDEKSRQRAEAFRTENGRILRILALALSAIMIVNIALRIMEAFK